VDLGDGEEVEVAVDEIVREEKPRKPVTGKKKQ